MVRFYARDVFMGEVTLKHLIECRGRWAGGPYECELKFSYYGKWSDKALKEHEEYEEEQNTEHDFWSGFEEINLFGKRERSSVQS